MKIKTYLENKSTVVAQALDTYMLPTAGPFTAHIEAMKYSLFVGGKRIRPILCLAAAEAIENSPETETKLLPVACALECIHTYSLIHDDLPAMDNDKLRRGKPTNHTVYGEAAAILAGDSLLTYAFDILSSEHTPSLSAEQKVRIINVISRASGPLGMVGGQSLDIASENTKYPFETLRTIHKSKTGALITCAIQSGAIGAGASAEQTSKLIEYGNCIGLAFQIVDDLLNATSTTEQLGKTAGSDADRGKATYPGYFGVEETRKKAKEAVHAARDALTMFDAKADSLRMIADYIYTRSH